MSIIPLLYELSDMDDFYPRRKQLDPFGLGINTSDILYPSLELYPNHRYRDSQVHQLQKLLRRKDNAVNESVGKDGFQVSMDVQQFKPSELNVKAVDDWIVVEGKHEEKKDDHGIVSRHFVRRYQLPKIYNPNQVAITLSTNGVLTVKAPPPPTTSGFGQERIIQIQQTAVKENRKIETNEYKHKDQSDDHGVTIKSIAGNERVIQIHQMEPVKENPKAEPASKDGFKTLFAGGRIKLRR